MKLDPQESLPLGVPVGQAQQEGLIQRPEAADSFVGIGLKGRYSPNDHPLGSFYIPMLSRAISYDRAVGYWSAAELQFAAQGTAQFLANGGRMRLIVGAQLNEADVQAVLSGRPLSDVVAARMLAEPALEGTKIVASEHLSVLAWMVAHDRLEIRVGVPTSGGKLLSYRESGKYFHTKYGVFTDRLGNKVAFNGSNNASVRAWAVNHETFDVYPSWMRAVWEWNGQEAVRDFDRHWNDQPDEGWAVVPLPQAVREYLIEHAPTTPPLPQGTSSSDDEDGIATEVEPPGATEAWAELIDLAAGPTKSPYTAVGTAQVDPLPHQARLIDRVVATYPRGYLLADEVGLGKTVEAGLVLRELFLAGKARKALLLVPASVMRQWQEELHEKMNLDVPRLEKGEFFDRNDELVPVPAGVNPWSALPIVLASSHLARRKDRRRDILAAGPWDIVLVDEAHHARRRGSKPSDTPNSLLGLLLEMRDKEMWQALYLASATPMQMNPHEAWDLISLLGLNGRWAESAADFLEYFERFRDNPRARGWKLQCEMLADYFADPDAERDQHLDEQINAALGFVGAWAVSALHENPPSAEARSQMPNNTSEWMDKWLRRHNPMRDRVFRNTRTTLREYQAAGIIADDVIIPTRHVNDKFIQLAPDERKLYDRIEEYIRRHYNSYKTDQSSQALGFIMTIYRRRLTSSFEAIKKSLTRRLDVLEKGKSLVDLLSDDDNIDVEDSLFEPETLEGSASRLQVEIHELRLFLNDLNRITGEDTKATQLVTDVNQSLLTYDSLVVFTQYTDTMDYVRERLIAAGITKIGCYSGRGGQIYNDTDKTWSEVSKAVIKDQFRGGELTVLIGTDSMSEGLNLQTAGRLINYDMPWNLMRVEQRIGRVDRIGASFKDIAVTNYFYADTVEQRVYEGIAEDYGDFTDIVGDAAPVLANIEKAIEQLALGDGSEEAIERQVDALKGEVENLNNNAIKAGDFGDSPEIIGHIEQPPELHGEIDLDDLEAVLTTNPLTGPHLNRVDGKAGVYRLTPPVPVASYSFATNSGTSTAADYLQGPRNAEVLVTFNTAVSDHSREGVALLTYGTPELEALLPTGCRVNESDRSR
ncbi:SNF2-related protein [Rhodococcus sp. ARC_M13]|uniref:DEAD/DEAH box helicase n=1 Tax=unclassified Rhodococcus (in: high G+C Gram-positive bacteria) TaxID=192944 RepID=UPI001FB45DCA|nr:MULTISPECIES: SNF2-related protein [unclassified Rhodococcus (in: high G+C Gram-positive bacteria)]MCJ0899163.1 SNF2-related protein [Rhodococcus sp. ARC_M13]MCJ0948953.1 SNF2-related protein [Rhodococcus sp. ARC_M8]